MWLDSLLYIISDYFYSLLFIYAGRGNHSIKNRDKMIRDHAIFVKIGRVKTKICKRKTAQRSKQSSKLSWTGQYNKCVQYDFKLTSVFRETLEIYLVLEALGAEGLPAEFKIFMLFW